MSYDNKSESTKNVQYLKNFNRASIVKFVATGEASSRSDLAKYTGLSKMAISSIVYTLISEGILEETGTQAGQTHAAAPGRRRIGISIKKRCLNAISVNIKRFQIMVAAADITGDVFYKNSIPIPKGINNKAFIHLVLEQIHRLMDEFPRLTFLGVGVSSIGPVDIRSKKILFPPNFLGLGDINIGLGISEEFHLPVYLDNGMNAIALSEYLYGEYKGTNNFVYLGLGTNVGCGVILNKEILHGNAGFSCEIGHTSIDYNGRLCYCGNRGCAELYTRTSEILRNTGAKSIQELSVLLEQGEVSPRIQEGLDHYCEILLMLLINIANTFDPQIILLGDEVSDVLDCKIQSLAKELNIRKLQQNFPKIILDKISIPLELGGVSLVFDRFFKCELPCSFFDSGEKD